MKYIKRAGAIILILCLAFITCSCGKKNSDNEVSNKKLDYSSGQMAVIIASQKNIVSSSYGDGIWSSSLSDGTSYSSAFYDDMYKFFEHMYILNQYAKDNDIKLSSQDENSIDAWADKLFTEVSNTENAFGNISKQDIKDIYSEYVRAGLSIDNIIANADTEVSQSEARIVRIAIIRTDNRQDILSAQSTIAEGGNFISVARQYTKDELVDIKISYSKLSDALKAALDNLTDGAVSDIIEDSGEYYIIKCISSFDEEATAENKKQLEDERITEAVEKIYSDYGKKIELSIDNKLWNETVNDNTAIGDINFYSCMDNE